MNEETKTELLRLEAEIARLFGVVVNQTKEIIALKEIVYATDLLCQEHRRILGPYVTSKELDEVERIVRKCQRG